ncbi:hypothetical protein BMETH_1804_0 [methanotrophic bacterial endosymbiont of Bathymodiolus sp.]|nr:hypothetical protein BMETH_1804_0 [methanotrophic bacterial endosymbiont of Bathymodiolus sp.]
MNPETLAFNLLSIVLGRFDEGVLMFAWEEGLEMIGMSLLCGGLIIGVYTVQKNEELDAT